MVDQQSDGLACGDACHDREQIEGQGQQDQPRIHAPQGKEHTQAQRTEGGDQQFLTAAGGGLVSFQTVDLLQVGESIMRRCAYLKGYLCFLLYTF